MNKKILLAFLTALPLATGCIIGGPPRPAPGDVTFTWTFAGGLCDDAAVKSVLVTIPGETLENGGLYPCASNGTAGIVLHNFKGKAYSFTLDGLSAAGDGIYTVSGTFSVNGNTAVSADLTPIGHPPSWAYVNWTFPADPNVTRPCFDRGIAFVDIAIDGAPANRYDCDAGLTSAGVKTVLLDAGNHTIDMWAITNLFYPLYGASSTLVTAAGHPTSQQYSLQWVVGGTSLKWQMFNGATAQTCAQAGMTTMFVTFQNVASGAVLYGTLADTAQWDRIDNFCAQFSFLQWSYLPPGTYRVFMRATGPGGTYDSPSPAPQVVITAASFPGEPQAQTVNLSKQ